MSSPIMQANCAIFPCFNDKTESPRESAISTIDKFNRNPQMDNLSFSVKLSAANRAFIRFVATCFGLPTVTAGVGENRQITVKRFTPEAFEEKFFLSLSWNSRNSITQLLQGNPLSAKELEILTPNFDKSYVLGSREERQKCMTGRLMGAVPQVPDAPLNTIHGELVSALSLRIRDDALNLPVRLQQAQIIQAINENRIFIIAGPQGCGKSTQIPQVLLEDCFARSQRCRAICTQPRRLAAHANADRVATERGETVGQSIGYQIRLESKVSPKTVLTFCTHGVLLRTIFADPTLLNATTHIIVDEIDEEDLFTRQLNSEGREVLVSSHRDVSSHACNLLLGTLQRILPQYPHLKLILLVNLKSISSIIFPQWSPVGVSHNDQPSEPMLKMQIPLFLEKSPGENYISGSFLLAKHYTDIPVICVLKEKPLQSVYFLEDILCWLDFNTQEMECAKRLISRDIARAVKMYFWLTGVPFSPLHCFGYSDSLLYDGNQGIVSFIGSFFTHAIIYISMNDLRSLLSDPVDTPNHRNIENLIWVLWENLILRKVYQKMHQNFVQEVDVQPLIADLLQSISVEWIPIDYRHSETGITPLMLFSAVGQLEVVERLLNLGADVFERVPLPRAALPAALVTMGSDLAAPFSAALPIIGANAFDLARLYGHAPVADLLKSHMATRSLNYSPDDWEGNLLRFGSWFANPMSQTSALLQPAKKSLLEQNYRVWKENHSNELTKLRLYQIARNWTDTDSVIHFELLAHLILKIDATMPPGSILVFLPSYEAIVALKEHLGSSWVTTQDSKRQRWIFVLHFRMLVADSRQIFLHPPPGVRKIVLTTDIAESSVAISDIAFVIDTGLLRKVGLEPKCFHLFSRLRLSSLEMAFGETHQQPSCRTMEELCLQAKLINPTGSNLLECFQSLPRIPNSFPLERSIRTLRIIDAWDESDDLTEFGSHMCDLPLPPRYSKMVLISIALKCVDPILTIACILACEDPFTLPTTAKERKDSQIVRKKFSADSLSDHMVLLRAFQFWQKARFEGWEENFCRKNYISAAVFDIVTTVRTQLLGQLRASGFVKARGSGDIRDLNTNSENWAIVKAAIVAGMYANLARTNPKTGDLCVSEHALPSDAKSSRTCLHWVRPSPRSVLATNLTESSPVDLKQLPPHWLVYDKLIGQCTQRGGVGGGDASSHRKAPKECAQSRKSAPRGLERKLLHCVTVVSPFTVALVAGPTRATVICAPHQDIASCADQANWGILGGHKKQPITLADIECILASANIDIPRLEDLITPQPEDGKLASSSSTTGMIADGKSRRRQLVLLRLDGPTGILAFECELEVARLLVDFRQKWNSLLLRKLRNPGKPSHQQDEAVLATIVAVLSAEEQVLGLRQPTGVGARPRPMATDLCNQNDGTETSNHRKNTLSSSVASQSAPALLDMKQLLLRQQFSTVDVLEFPALQAFPHGDGSIADGNMDRKLSECGVSGVDNEGDHRSPIFGDMATLAAMQQGQQNSWHLGAAEGFGQMKVPASPSVHQIQHNHSWSPNITSLLDQWGDASFDASLAAASAFLAGGKHSNETAFQTTHGEVTRRGIENAPLLATNNLNLDGTDAMATTPNAPFGGGQPVRNPL